MAIIELSLCNGQLFSLRLGPNGTNYNQLKDHPHRNNTAPARCLSARRESRRDECKLADYCVKVFLFYDWFYVSASAYLCSD